MDSPREQDLARRFQAGGSVPDIPASVDAAILGAAGRMAFRQRWGRRVRRGALPLAAAAALLAGVVLWQRSDEPVTHSPDVVDALRLRIALAEGRAESGDDQNGDGQVDSRDVGVLLDAVVKLPGRNG